MVNRLKEKYDKEIVPSMMEKFNYTSIMQTPKIDKIVINMGVGDAVANAKNLDEAVEELTLIVREQLIFPEIDFDNVNKVRGLDIVIVTTANTDEESRELLTQLGMPFAK